MKPVIMTALVGSLLLFGCNQQQEQAAAPAAAEPGTYTATGTVQVVNPDTVMLDHSAVAELEWPAMVMTYEVPDAAMVNNLKPGEPVRFSFRQNENGFGYVLTNIQPQ
jgi:Cu(I)/Ag(I) efflux system membrane fusion protein